MGAEESPTDKAEEIERQAHAFDAKIRHSWPNEPDLPPYRGGVLVLGKYYAQSRRIYFGLNPGGDGNRFEVAPNLQKNLNPPFDFPAEQDGDYHYWDNWKAFLRRHDDLRAWFNNRVTSAVLIPWRTKSSGEAEKLNPRLGFELFKTSGALVQKLLEHHDPELLLVGGKKGLDWLSGPNFLGIGRWKAYVVDEHKMGIHHQWRKVMWSGAVNDRSYKFTIIQVPHFSYANSHERLLPRLAAWLRVHLSPFGL